MSSSKRELIPLIPYFVKIWIIYIYVYVFFFSRMNKEYTFIHILQERRRNEENSFSQKTAENRWNKESSLVFSGSRLDSNIYTYVDHICACVKLWSIYTCVRVPRRSLVHQFYHILKITFEIFAVINFFFFKFNYSRNQIVPTKAFFFDIFLISKSLFRSFRWPSISIC